MGLDKILKEIAAWAETEEVIWRVYFFGSRLKGTHSLDSDLDIALEIVKGVGDTSFCAAFAFDKQDFISRIQPLSPFKIDLCLYAGSNETPDVCRYIEDASLVIYDAELGKKYWVLNLQQGILQYP